MIRPSMLRSIASTMKHCTDRIRISIDPQRAQPLRSIHVQQHSAFAQKCRDFGERRAKPGRVIQHAERDQAGSLVIAS